jgi:Icc-related predicted phosphoesterase
MGGLTKIFFTSDVHGSNACFMKFVNAAKVYDVDVLILGGDITGKMIVSIVEDPDGTYSSEYLGIKHVLTSKEELQNFEKLIRDSGFYPYITNAAEVLALYNDKKLQDDLFNRVMVHEVERWVKIAEERLKGTKVKCYISPGNDDRLSIDPVLRSSSVVHCPEDEVVWIDDHHEMITTGWTNATPWKSPRETTEEKLAEKIEQMITKVERMPNCIFNLHCPPYGTSIDVAPELDETLKPKVNPGAGVSYTPVGSVAVRQAIEDHQPLLGIHGHIHESRGFVRLGRTLCLNPGSEYGEAILHGALIALDDKRVKSYALTQG